ncbi:MAG: response regulator [Xenococcaceae cyanobacterium MO_167.B52]|nr:response regulator [Xenococcaceae cyanobacterium MO_167.B52]
MNTITNHKPMEILLVEDSESDALLISKTFSRTQMKFNLTVIKDGVEAVSFLHKEGQYDQTPRPDIIFLDLHLPKKNGLGVLAEIKSEPNLRNIPVIILTSSNSQKDVQECYQNNANCYLTKPTSKEDFCHTVKIIEDFWLNIAKLPLN